MKLKVNGKAHDLGEIDPGTPLLWVLRDHLAMTGTKFGCGRGLCGACTVHVDGKALRSCTLRVGDLGERAVTTIEGLAKGERLHAVQEAWMELAVPQCGFCQPGQIMSAAALLAAVDEPSDEDIDKAMSGNICRCGTYSRIREGIKRAAAGTLAVSSGEGSND